MKWRVSSGRIVPAAAASLCLRHGEDGSAHVEACDETGGSYVSIIPGRRFQLVSIRSRQYSFHYLRQTGVQLYGNGNYYSVFTMNEVNLQLMEHTVLSFKVRAALTRMRGGEGFRYHSRPSSF